jgi:hypothetical protein
MPNDSRGIQGWSPDDLIDTWLLAQHHHGVPRGREPLHSFHGWPWRRPGWLIVRQLFNILVDAVVRKWVRLLEEDRDYKEGDLAVLTSTFFAIFCVDDVYLASRDACFLQHALTLLVGSPAMKLSIFFCSKHHF